MLVCHWYAVPSVMIILQKWTGKYFRKAALKDIGLLVQLGHNGGPCLSPGRRNTKFVVCDVNGFHEVDVCFCSCRRSEEKSLLPLQQVLRFGWFPATQEQPTTAFTFDLLNFLHQLNHQGKTSLYDFHRTLLRVTNNSIPLSMVDLFMSLFSLYCSIKIFRIAMINCQLFLDSGVIS